MARAPHAVIHPRRVVIGAALWVSLAAAAGAAPEPAPPAPAPGPCRAPEAKDADLARGLDQYLRGEWSAARAALQSWAARPEAAEDPAAARGYYSLGFTLQAAGDAAGAGRWRARALPLLQARVEEAPTLEELYYLASLHRDRGDTSAQLTTVSRALQLVEGGRLCAEPNADDDFRLARLQDFAGRGERELELLQRAAAKYAKGEGDVLAYEALVNQRLAAHHRRRGEAEPWLQHARRAAELDASLPGIHRSVGLALLALSRPTEAAAYWRMNWRKERQAGNGLVYDVRVLDRLLALQKRHGDAHRIENLSEYTVAAIEQNALHEAGRVLALRAELAGLEAPPEEKRTELEQAECRTFQFLAEYVKRGQDLQEFALRNQILPVIHGRSLPS